MYLISNYLTCQKTPKNLRNLEFTKEGEKYLVRVMLAEQDFNFNTLGESNSDGHVAMRFCLVLIKLYLREKINYCCN